VLLKKGTIVKGKGSWTEEEDAALKALVKKHGRTKWSFIGKFLPGRVGKQCRERWHNHLNPDLNKRAWTEDEEKLIVEQRAKLGNRWARIARMLPGRSDNDVKNRWYASLRKRVDEGE
jgi:transcriptional activator Myb